MKYVVSICILENLIVVRKRDRKLRWEIIFNSKLVGVAMGDDSENVLISWHMGKDLKKVSLFESQTKRRESAKSLKEKSLSH